MTLQPLELAEMSDASISLQNPEDAGVCLPPDSWPDPRPLPSGLSRVDPFNFAFLPASLAPWVADIAKRLQCPPDFVAVGAVTALGTALGRRIGIRPQQKTDWVEYANLWGLIIGSPGTLKSPALNEALKPIRLLEAEAVENHNVAMSVYEPRRIEHELRTKANLNVVTRALNKNPGAKIDLSVGDVPEEPILVRYYTSDSSYEALGELLIKNPYGILVERDELISLLKTLDREDQTVARGFYLTGWNGSSPYSFDRISRGHRYLDAVCLSVLEQVPP
jgi:Protein of unknown function (DUF3987)